VRQQHVQPIRISTLNVPIPSNILLKA